MTTRGMYSKPALPAFLSMALLLLTAGKAPAAQTRHNVPPSVQQALDQGPANPDEEVNLTLHLKMSNRAAFDAAVEQRYDPASANYHKWMTDADLQQYAPTASQIAAVKSEVAKHGLSVISTDRLGFSIRVHGTIANVQTAFQTSIHQLARNGKMFSANVSDAQLTGEAGQFVSSVSGLVRTQVRPMMKRALDPRTGIAFPAIPLDVVNAGGGLSSIITDTCLTGPQTFTYTDSANPLPVGVYFGNVYGGTGKICDYTASQLQAHYGLSAAYAAGLDGTGETIALVEAYGYPNILADANAFAQLNGLPPLDSSNFDVVYPQGPPRNPNAGILTGWYVEIALDVQWAHAMAPGAKILVVAAAGQDNEDFQDALNYVVNNHLANSVSNSWEEDLDLIAGPLELASYDTVLEQAAAQGVSVHFSSGDGGDDGLGSPIGSPEVPSNSPYATAIGGTSILNVPNGSGQEELGWGNGLTELAVNGPLDPPVQIGIIGGAGGGESSQYPKPSWQSALPGTGRQVPDVSALADPYTGVPIVVTENNTQVVFVGVGGTSLACPIFSAIWALADQSAGQPLGQAARRIATMSSDQVTDIVPHSSLANVAGFTYDSKGVVFRSPASLLSLSLFNTTQFVSAIWPIAPGIAYDLSFGTDSSLTVTPGWDNVTGFGVPNGLPFIVGAAGQ